MKERYIKFFKKEIVFLLILLIIVCFSFGLTYSNFIYSSDSYRAVEMFTSKLKYEIDNETLIASPGNNLFKINIKSLNNIDSYYKVIFNNNEDLSIKYFDNNTNIIEANKSINVNLVVYNNTNKNISFNINVIGGFITNNYNDIQIDKDYNVVNDNIEIGKILTINNQTFKLLNINNDGSLELISDATEDVLNIEGFHGYNQYINTINNNININDIVSKKAVSIEDIEKYTKNKIVEYETLNYYSDVYYPSLWASEEDAIINNIKQSAFFNKSEGVSNGNYEHADSIVLKDIIVNNPIFINDKYKDIFLNSNYLIATRYQKASQYTALWGILSIKDKKIELNPLFESNLKNYIVNGNSRVIITTKNMYSLFN